MTYDQAIAALQGMSAQLVTAEHPNVFEQIIAAIRSDSDSRGCGKLADGTPATLGQEAFFDWNGKMRSGHVKAFVDAGTLYIALELCHPTESGARQAADYRPAKPKVQPRSKR